MSVAAVSTVLDAPIGVLWPLLDDFASWHVWIPGIDSTVMADGLDQTPVGSIRILTRADGTTIRERLLAKDGTSLSYSFDGAHPFPVRRYVGTVRAEPVTTSDTTFLHWSGEYDTDAADEQRAADLFRGIYLSFFVALASAVAVRVPA